MVNVRQCHYQKQIKGRRKMKKTMVIAILIVGIALVFGCKSSPKEIGDKDFQKIYNRYKNDLILDGAETYTVKSGDTLSAISRAQYQNGFYFPVIMLASSEVVSDPDKIEPGMELTIPDLQKNLDHAKSKASIKKCLTDVAKLEDSRNRPQDAEGLRKLADSL